MARLLALLSFLLSISVASAQTSWPNQREGDVVLKDFRFDSGETLGELKLHYTTLGTPRRDASGDVTNAVLLLHGTNGTGKTWLSRSMPSATSSSCPTASGGAARASRATGCACDFPTIATAI
jgi:homoserine O-acetyltransferase/O-succinyltransferase